MSAQDLDDFMLETHEILEDLLEAPPFPLSTVIGPLSRKSKRVSTVRS